MPKRTWNRRKKWDSQKVVDAILQIHRSGGKLNSGYIQKSKSSLYNGALRYCGGWRQAVEVAGLSYDTVRVVERKRPVWSEEKIVNFVLSRADKGQPLNSVAVREQDNNLYAAASRYFGTWAEALAAAGIDSSDVYKTKRWSPLSVLEAINLRAQGGQSLRTIVLELEDLSLLNAARRHFGSWSQARFAAGFSPVDPHPAKIWDEASIVREIKELYAGGVPLNIGAIQKAHGYILSAGQKVFGTWENAVNAAGFNYADIRKIRPKRWWSKARIVRMIQELDGRGIHLGSRRLQRSHPWLHSAGVKLFGYWGYAVAAAGIDYRRHLRYWSTKAWLRQLSDDEAERILSNPIVKKRRSRPSASTKN